MSTSISDDDVLARLRALGGAARFAELGATRYQLRRLVDAGRVRSPAAGAFALPDAPAALVAATVLNGVVGCVSALRRWGVDTYDDDRHHVSVPVHRGAKRACPQDVVRHHEDVRPVARTRYVGLVEAAARAAWCLSRTSYDHAVAVLDQVLRTEAR